MPSVGEIYADVGLHVDNSGLSSATSMFQSAESSMTGLGTAATATSGEISGSFSSGLSGASSAVEGFSSSSTGAFESVSTGAVSAGTAFTGLGTTATSASNTISGTLTTGIKNVGSSLTGLVTNSSAFQSLSSGAQTAGTALVGLTQKSTQLKNEMGATGTVITGLFTGALVSGIKDVVGVYSSFDDQMRQVQAVTSATGEQFNQLTAQAKQLGADTSFTSQEVAEGMTILGQAGFNATQVYQAMPGTLDLARASMTGLGTSVDILTTTMTGFQMGANQTSTSADVLAKAANISATDVTGIGEAMKYTSSLANSMGWSLQETAATVGLLSNAGIKGSMAGTVLRNSITRLIAPTNNVVAVLKNYGISLDDINPQTHKLADILDLLAAKGVSTGDIMEIFGMRAGPGMLALLSKGSGALRDYTTQLDNSAGYAKNAAKEMDAGMGGALRQLEGSIETFKITLGEDLAYTLKDAVLVAAKLVNAYELIPDPIRKVAAAFVLLGTGALVVVSGLGTVGLIAGAAAPALGVLGISADAAAGSITAFGVTLSAVEWATGIGEVAALAAALIYLDEKTGVISGTLSFLSDVITVDWGVLSDFVGGVIDDISGYIDDLETSLNGISEDLHLDGVINFFTGLSDTVSTVIGNVHQTAESYRNAGSEIQASNESTKTSITAVGTTSQTTAATNQQSTGIISQAWQALTGDVSQANSTMADSAKTAADDTKSAWDEALNEMQQTYDMMQNMSASGVEGNNSQLADKLSKGIQGNGQVLGIDNENELVIQSIDGTIQKLNQLNSTQDMVFQGIDKNYGIIIDDGTRSQDELNQQAIKYREMGDEVIVVKAGVDGLNGSSLSGINTQADMLKGTFDQTTGSVSLLGGQITLANDGTLTNINGQVASLNTGVSTATGNADVLRSSLTMTNATPMSTLLGNTQNVNSSINTATGSTHTLNSTLGQTNSTPFGTIQGNLNTTGGIVDTDKSKTGLWNSTLGQTNSSPFGTLHGNLNTSGSTIDTNKSKTGLWNSTLGNTNSSPFGTLHGNLNTTGTKLVDDKKKTDDANGSMKTLGSMSFSSTISGLGSIWDKLGGIYDRAKTAVSELLKVGSTSSSVSSASSGITSHASNIVTNNNSSIYHISTVNTPMTPLLKRASGG